MKLRRILLLAALVMGFAFTANAGTPDGDARINYAGREMIVHVPAKLAAPGNRALVIVLHGGLGNAERIASSTSESALNMDSVADKGGFIVAYLNGTAVTRFFGSGKEGWNAGNCCGQPARNNVDDVTYITGAVTYLTKQYAVNPARVYAIGHSNGAMMADRLICETNVFAAAVPISGQLGLIGRCQGAHGKRILAIHGAQDKNVPIEGGKGKGLSGTDFNSEEYSMRVMTNSGASYTLQIVPGAGHQLSTIEDAIEKSEGVTLAQKAAIFFGLLPSQTK